MLAISDQKLSEKPLDSVKHIESAKGNLSPPSGSRESYGFRYFDKPVDYDDEEDDDREEEYEEKSCSSNCCDGDCECDDCLRCSDMSMIDSDAFRENAAAA